VSRGALAAGNLERPHQKRSPKGVSVGDRVVGGGPCAGLLGCRMAIRHIRVSRTTDDPLALLRSYGRRNGRWTAGAPCGPGSAVAMGEAPPSAIRSRVNRALPVDQAHSDRGGSALAIQSRVSVPNRVDESRLRKDGVVKKVRWIRDMSRYQKSSTAI
jgi:hypothetical protein